MRDWLGISVKECNRTRYCPPRHRTPLKPLDGCSKCVTMMRQAITDMPYVAASLDRRYELRSLWARGKANELLGRLEAGAYTRPLSSSTSAVSDTKYTMNTPSYRRTPPKHPLNNPKIHPLYHTKRLR